MDFKLGRAIFDLAINATGFASDLAGAGEDVSKFAQSTTRSFKATYEAFKAHSQRLDQITSQISDLTKKVEDSQKSQKSYQKSVIESSDTINKHSKEVAENKKALDEQSKAYAKAKKNADEARKKTAEYGDEIKSLEKQLESLERKRSRATTPAAMSALDSSISKAQRDLGARKRAIREPQRTVDAFDQLEAQKRAMEESVALGQKQIDDEQASIRDMARQYNNATEAASQYQAQLKALKPIQDDLLDAKQPSTFALTMGRIGEVAGKTTNAFENTRDVFQTVSRTMDRMTRGYRGVSDTVAKAREELYLLNDQFDKQQDRIRQARESQKVIQAKIEGTTQQIAVSQALVERRLASIEVKRLEILEQQRIIGYMQKEGFSESRVNTEIAKLQVLIKNQAQYKEEVKGTKLVIEEKQASIRRMNAQYDAAGEYIQQQQTSLQGLRIRIKEATHSLQEKIRGEKTSASSTDKSTRAIRQQTRAGEEQRGWFSWLFRSHKELESSNLSIAQSNQRMGQSFSLFGRTLQNNTRNVHEYTGAMSRLRGVFQMVLALQIDTFLDTARRFIGSGPRLVQGFEDVTFSIKALVATQEMGRDSTLSFAEAFEKSAKPTGELIKFLEDLAIKSTYTSQELSGVFQTLSVSFETKFAVPITKILSNFGDATRQSVYDLEGIAVAMRQINDRGYLQLEEVNQLQDRNVKALDYLAAYFGKTKDAILEDISAGAIGAEDALTAILQGLESKFEGAGEQAQYTFSGLFSSIKDLSERGLRALFTPAMEAAREPLIAVVEVLGSDDLMTRITDLGIALGDTLGTAFGFLTDTIIPGFVAAVETIGPIVEDAFSVIADLAGSAFDWGWNITEQLAEGMSWGAGSIIDTIMDIGSSIGEWLMPGSPPKVLPHVDAWGANVTKQFVGGMVGVDTKKEAKNLQKTIAPLAGSFAITASPGAGGSPDGTPAPGGDVGTTNALLQQLLTVFTNTFDLFTAVFAGDGGPGSGPAGRGSRLSGGGGGRSDGLMGLFEDRLAIEGEGTAGGLKIQAQMNMLRGRGSGKASKADSDAEKEQKKAEKEEEERFKAQIRLLTEAEDYDTVLDLLQEKQSQYHEDQKEWMDLERQILQIKEKKENIALKAMKEEEREATRIQKEQEKAEKARMREEEKFAKEDEKNRRAEFGYRLKEAEYNKDLGAQLAILNEELGWRIEGTKDYYDILTKIEKVNVAIRKEQEKQGGGRADGLTELGITPFDSTGEESVVEEDLTPLEQRTEEIKKTLDRGKTWGGDFIKSFASGMGERLGTLLDAIGKIGDLFEHWFAPGSPPRIARDIDKWGENLVHQFFLGIEQATGTSFHIWREKIEDQFKPLIDLFRDNMDQVVSIGRIVVASLITKAAWGHGIELLKNFARALGIVSLNITKLVTPFRLLLVASGVLFQAWQKNWGGFRDIVSEMGEKLLPLLSSVSDIFGDLVRSISSGQEAVLSELRRTGPRLLSTISQMATVVLSGIAEWVAPVFYRLTGLIAGAFIEFASWLTSNGIAWVSKAVGVFASKLATDVQNAASFLMKSISPFAEVFGDLARKFLTGLLQWVGIVSSGIGVALLDAILVLIKPLTEGAVRLAIALLPTVPLLVSTIGDVIAVFAGWLLSEGLYRLVDILTNTISSAFDALGKNLPAIGRNVGYMFGRLFTEAIGVIAITAINLPRVAMLLGRWLLTSLLPALRTFIHGLAEGIIRMLVGFIEGMISLFTQALGAISLLNAIVPMFEPVVQFLDDVTNKIAQFFGFRSRDAMIQFAESSAIAKEAIDVVAGALVAYVVVVQRQLLVAVGQQVVAFGTSLVQSVIASATAIRINLVSAYNNLISVMRTGQTVQQRVSSYLAGVGNQAQVAGKQLSGLSGMMQNAAVQAGAVAVAFYAVTKAIQKWDEYNKIIEDGARAILETKEAYVDAVDLVQEFDMAYKDLRKHYGHEATQEMKTRIDDLRGQTEEIEKQVVALIKVKNGWDEKNDPVGAWLYRLTHEGRNTDEQMAYLRQQLIDLGVEIKPLKDDFNAMVDGMKNAGSQAADTQRSIEDLRREADTLKQSLQTGLGRITSATTDYKRQEIDEYDEYASRLESANADHTEEMAGLQEDGNKALFDIEKSYQADVDRLWSDWHAADDATEKARIETQMAEREQQYATDVADTATHYDALLAEQEQYHADWLAAEEESYKERAKQRAIQFAQEQAERKAEQGRNLIEYVRNQTEQNNWNKDKAAELMDELAKEYGVQQEVSAVTMLSMERDISSMMSQVEPEIDTLIDLLGETSDAAEDMDEKMKELEEQRISELEQQFRVDTQNVSRDEYMEMLDDFIDKLEDIPSEVRTQVITEYIDEEKEKRRSVEAGTGARSAAPPSGGRGGGAQSSPVHQDRLLEIKTRYNRLIDTATEHYDKQIAAAQNVADRAALQQEKQKRINELEAAYEKEVDKLAVQYPRRAIGGTMPFMTPTLVGERGPELVMPRMANMRIIPNHRLTDGLTAFSQNAMQSLSGLASGGRHMAGSLGGHQSPITITINNPVVDTPERLQQLENKLRDVAQTVIDDVLEGSIDALTIQGW